MIFGTMRSFKTRYEANKIAERMRGWKIKIVKSFGTFKIQCNGTKYLRINGSIE